MSENVKYGYIPKKGIVEKGVYGLSRKLTLTRSEFEQILLEISPYPDMKEYQKFANKYGVGWGAIRNMHDLYMCTGQDLDKMDFSKERNRGKKHGKSRFGEEVKGIRELPNL